MAEPAVEQKPSARGPAADEDRLAQFGYKQELKRDWGLAHNFGISFSIIVSSSIPRCCASTAVIADHQCLDAECHHGNHHPIFLWIDYWRTCWYVSCARYDLAAWD